MKRLCSSVAALAVCLSVCASAQDAPVVIFAPSGAEVAVNAIDMRGEDYVVDVVSPTFSGFPGAQKLNQFADDLVADGIGALNRAVIDNMEYIRSRTANGERPSGCGYYTDFDYWEGGDYLSLSMLSYIYTGGAHGMSYKNTLTVNKRTGEPCSLGELFRSGADYKGLLESKILAEIKAQPEMYFEHAAGTVTAYDGDFSFYLDAGELVVFFSLYDITPYAAGMPRFCFDAATLKDILAGGVYTALAGASKSPPVRIKYNGADLGFDSGKNAHMQGGVAMVPLRLMAEALGYEVGWTPETGALVAGGQIREGEDSYFTSQKAAQKLGVAATVKNGVTFVPSEYFSVVLGEDVSYYDQTVRMYGKSKNSNPFYSLIPGHTDALSAEECVKAYALALKLRNGAEQYALLSKSLRYGMRASFEELSWVTGTSSPWIRSYTVEKISETDFQLTLYWQTSAGPAGSDDYRVTAAETGGTFRITSIT